MPIRRSRVLLLTLIAMIAFAANSILCRLALGQPGIDAASFTSIRLLSGALVLWLIVVLRGAAGSAGGSGTSAIALFAYAAAFSFAYVSLPTGVGALLLFGAVQATMILAGLRAGERLKGRQTTGLRAFGRTGIRRGLCRVVRGLARFGCHPRGDGAAQRAVIAAAGGTVLLGEPVTRLAFASVAILGGIALVVLGRSNKPEREKAM